MRRKPGIGKGIGQIAHRPDIALAISFVGGANASTSIRTGLDAAVDQAREMNPQEWKFWVGNRLNLLRTSCCRSALTCSIRRGTAQCATPV